MSRFGWLDGKIEPEREYNGCERLLGFGVVILALLSVAMTALVRVVVAAW